MCHSIQLNVVARHGTRYPTEGSSEDMYHFYNKTKSFFGSDQPSWFQDWEFPYTAEKSGLLNSRGKEELRALGKWLSEQYPHLAPKDIEDIDGFFFESTHKKRTHQSAQSFIDGFYNSVHYRPNATIHVDPEGRDWRLRYLDNCALWNSQIEENDTATIEYELYLEQPHIQNFVKELPSLLLKNGGAANKKLTFTTDDFDTAYDMCSYDMALHNDASRWCSLFEGEEEMLRWMNFYKDIKYFWRRGYGYDMNWEVSTPLLKDLFSSMYSHIHNEPSALKGHFRFGHSQTLFPLLTMLQVYPNDEAEVFLRTTTKTIAWNRSQRLSYTGPFGSNAIFVLYDCGYGEYKVKLLVNQKEVVLPACDDVYCDFGQLEKAFGYYLHQYDYFEECREEATE